MRSADVVKNIYPTATVPGLNYPRYWVYLYAALFTDSEDAFQICWRVNAVLLMICILGLCVRFRQGPLMFAATLFSPIVLLCTERGNFDAIVLLLTTSSLLAYERGFCRGAIGGLFLGLACALKLFPIFALTPFVLNSRRSRRFLPAFLSLTPFAIYSAFQFSGETHTMVFGFVASYGLRSVSYLMPSPHSLLTEIAVILATSALIGVATLKLRGAGFSQQLGCEARAQPERDRMFLIAFLCIFLGTFLLFVNWAYRLIFTIPVFYVASHFSGRSGVVMRLFFALMFWAPVAPWGWGALNLVCYGFCPVGLLLLARCALDTSAETAPPSQSFPKSARA